MSAILATMAEKDSRNFALSLLNFYNILSLVGDAADNIPDRRQKLETKEIIGRTTRWTLLVALNKIVPQRLRPLRPGLCYMEKVKIISKLNLNANQMATALSKMVLGETMIAPQASDTIKEKIILSNGEKIKIINELMFNGDFQRIKSICPFQLHIVMFYIEHIVKVTSELEKEEEEKLMETHNLLIKRHGISDSYHKLFLLSNRHEKRVHSALKSRAPKVLVNLIVSYSGVPVFEKEEIFSRILARNCVASSVLNDFHMVNKVVYNYISWIEKKFKIYCSEYCFEDMALYEMKNFRIAAIECKTKRIHSIEAHLIEATITLNEERAKSFNQSGTDKLFLSGEYGWCGKVFNRALELCR